MTEQVSDSCTFDGRKWRVDEWDGSTDCIPSNDKLGIRTGSPNTANWHGRIDHFLVHHQKLHLFKIEATLPLSELPRIPAGARREVVQRHVPIELHTDDGRTDEIRIERQDFFVFDNLIIPFTGRLYLSYPYVDFWEVPWPIREQDEVVSESLVLVFEKGFCFDR